MILTFNTLDVSNPPNFFMQTPNWSVRNADKLWFVLQINDALGTRRYIPPPNASVAIIFPRAVEPMTGNDRNIRIDAVAHQDDKSLFSFNITKEQAANIISGAAILEYKLGTDVQQFRKEFAVQVIL